MAQRTVVMKLDPAAQRALQERLDGGDFEYRPVPHARFSARGEGVVATLYGSGKLVIQGAEPELFAERYLGGAAVPAQPARTPAGVGKATIALDRPLIGSDETGKGDYFGPLVVAAFKLDPGAREELAASGATDSKALSDERALRLGAALRERYPHAVVILDPPEYNREHARKKNLNPILAELHGRAIRELHEPGIQVLVDRFANEKLVAGELKGLDLELHQEVRAERELAVAAASVIARGVFLERLAELSEEYAVDLHKGAGAPTDKAARRFVSIHGFDALDRVAKLHFKNTKKIPQ